MVGGRVVVGKTEAWAVAGDEYAAGSAVGQVAVVAAERLTAAGISAERVGGVEVAAEGETVEKQAVEGPVARGGKSSVPTVARLALPGPVHERSVRDPRDLEVCLACQRARCE